MTYIAITCGGNGDLWMFETRTSAFLHPLVQYGDAMLGGPGDVLDSYNRLEWAAIADRAGVRIGASDTALLLRGTHVEAEAIRRRTAFLVWDGLVARAVPHPTESDRICEIVSRDRRRGVHPVSKKMQATPESVTDAPTTENAEAATPVAKKEKVAAGPRAPKGTELNSVIRFRQDKNGVAYGPDNNPKRPGTAGHQRFALYVDGMTVSEALAAGIWGADVAWDIEHGFISVTGGTAAVPSPTEEVSSEGADAQAEEPEAA